VLRQLLTWLLPPGRVRDGLLGDLDELYAERLRRGRIAADLWYLRQLLSAARYAAGRLRSRGDVGERGLRSNSARATTNGWALDLRSAARGLRRSPGFTAAVVATLALGIGANAAVFGLVDRVLLRPPPYERPDELVLVWATLGSSGERAPVPAPDAAMVEERASSLLALGFMGRAADGTLAPEEDETPEHVVVARVTPDLFDVLGVTVARGRGFRDEDVPAAAADADGVAPPTVLVSDEAWRRVFRADPSLPGRTVRLNGRPAVVVGVLPAGFHLALPPSAGIGARVDVWVPLRIPLGQVGRADGRLVDQDTDNTGAVVARLAPGATLDRVQDDLDRVVAELRAEAPGYAAVDYGLVARPLQSDATAHAKGLLVALLAGAAGVLVVACLSLSALLLARGLAREGELAVRAALGASRGRLFRHLLGESLLLLAAGGALALLVASEAGRALATLVPPGLASPGDPPPGWRLPAFAAAATACALPLFAAIAGVEAGLLSRGRRAGALLTRGRFRRGRAREVLVVAEVAVSLVLVLGAGLLLRTARELGAVHPGFTADRALGFDVSIRIDGAYQGPAERARLVRSLEEAVRAVPGIRAVGLTGALPLSGRRWAQPWGLPGQAPSAWGTEGRADFRVITSGYFEAMGTRLLAGRSFSADEDLDERQRVVIVDEALAERIAGRSALGTAIGIPLDGRAVEARVVGIVESVRHEDLGTPGRGTIYIPYRQEASRDVSFVLRSEGDPAAVAPAVRRAVLAVEPRLGVYGMRTVTDLVDAELGPARFGLTLLSAYSAMGLLAAALGLYGVVAWEAGRRTRDLGVRMALGATSAGIRRTVLAAGLKLSATGILCGALLAALALGGLRRLVFGVEVTDPVTWAGAVALVVAVTLLACWMPAARAARLDPVTALRAD
jgi:predicted permease